MAIVIPLITLYSKSGGFWNIQKIKKKPPELTSPICWTTARYDAKKPAPTAAMYMNGSTIQAASRRVEHRKVSELMPYAFGYMMSAKVGTGLVAEIGAMRISDEIDALEVMGINSLVYLCATRLLAAWMVLPFMYIAAVGAGFFASYLAVVQQIGEVSSGGFFLIFWMFQNPPDLIYSLIKGMAMATVIVLIGCYYGYTASGGPVGVGTATAKSMVLNTVMVHLVGMVGTQIFWGSNPRAPIGG